MTKTAIPATKRQGRQMKVTATVQLSGDHAVKHRTFTAEVEDTDHADRWIDGLRESAERQGHALVVAIIH